MCGEDAPRISLRRRVNWHSLFTVSRSSGLKRNVVESLPLGSMVVPVHLQVTMSTCMVEMMDHVAIVPSTSWIPGHGHGRSTPVLDEEGWVWDGGM